MPVVLFFSLTGVTPRVINNIELRRGGAGKYIRRASSPTTFRDWGSWTAHVAMSPVDVLSTSHFCRFPIIFP